MTTQDIVLTGDRTTGRLHLGHYVGSLRNRLVLQENYKQYILLADLQAMTDNADDPHKVARNVIEVALDYLAVGIDPNRSTICLQSALPALSELTVLYLNYVTVSRLQRNPTVKDEIASRGFDRSVPAGFLCYPVSQAADITAFKANLIPVGADQQPMIEQTNEIVRRINNQIGAPVLVECQALIPTVGGRLVGTDGKGKMSKSLGNVLELAASPAEITAAVRSMYTDPNHLRVEDPGTVEGNVVFAYLDAFDPDQARVEDLKDRYRAGGLGDGVVKAHLEDILQEMMRPMRERRAEYEANIDYVVSIIRDGTARANEVTNSVLQEVRDGLGLFNIGRSRTVAFDREF